MPETKDEKAVEFLAEGGEMGARMRALDWSATPLGPPAGWPQSLKSVVSACLNSPMLGAVLWGSDLLFLYNDAYIPSLVGRHPHALGRPVAEVWGDAWEQVRAPFDIAMATGKGFASEQVPIAILRDGRLQDTCWDFTAAPIRGEEGRVVGLLNQGVEITSKLLAERQQRFRLEIEDQLRAASEPRTMMSAAVEALGRHLGANRVGYTEIQDDDETIVCDACFADGVIPLLGASSLTSYGPEAIARQRQGITEVCDDVTADPAQVHATWAKLDTRAFMAVPLVRGGRFTASLYVNFRDVHRWTAEEVALVEEVAARTWTGVEQARAEAALRESEEQLRLATEAAEVGQWDLDPLSDTLFWPARVKAMFGIAADRPISMADFYAGLHPDDARATGDAFAAATDPDRRAIYDVEYRTIGKEDGIVRWVAAKGRAIFSADGRCTRVIGTAIDITARKTVEQELRQLNVELERRVLARSLDRGLLWEHTPDLFSVIDMTTGTFDAVNPAWSTTLGWRRDEIEGSPYTRFVHPDDAGTSDAEFERVRLGKPAMRFENRYRHSDGSWRWMSWVAVPEGGKLYSSTRDITEEKARAADLLLHENIVQSHRSPVVAFDPDYRLIAFNQAHSEAFFHLFGHRATVGDDLLELFPPDQQDVLRAAMNRALAGESFTMTETYGEPGLAQTCFEVSYFPLTDEDGRVIGAFHHANDISARKRAEAELEAAQEALRQSQKMEAMGSLTGGVAHDFNNLLTPIVGSLDMLQRRGVGNEREQRLIAGAMQSAERAKTLVQRLLAFARRQPLQPVPVDLAKLVAGMGDLVSSTTGPQIRVVVEAPDGLPAAHADPNQIEMALLNLSVNARDAMPDGGTLRITASSEAVGEGHRAALREGDYLRLSVADTGAGMDEATILRAIEPFFSTKGVGKGTGLGLSMVHGLASQLGGALTIRSQPGRGTDVELWLPRSADAIVEESVAQDAPDWQPGRGVSLLVDDEELVRMSTSDMLTDLGYTVIEAASAEEALRLIRQGEHFDLLVTDHLMPGITGTELIREVRGARPGVAALLVSGYAEADGIETDVPRLTKPFRKDELASSLAQITPTKAL